MTLNLLAKLKFQRDSIFDVFGYSAERKMERSLIKEYETLVPKVLDRLTKENYELCLDIKTLFKQLEEFESIKKAS